MVGASFVTHPLFEEVIIYDDDVKANFWRIKPNPGWAPSYDMKAVMKLKDSW